MEENNVFENINEVENINEDAVTEESVVSELHNEEEESYVINVSDDNDNDNDNDNESDDELELFFSSDADDIINVVEPTPVEAAANRKGFKFFILFVAAALILTVFTTIGYFAGKSGNTNKNHSLNLATKPTDTAAYTADAVYEIVNKSVVGVAVYNSEGAGGYASGVIYSEDGYIITNDHIYAEVPAAKFMVYTYDGKVYPAEYVAGDARSDLAVLKINESGFFPATFGDSDELKYGEQVVAVGRPDDATASSSITAGYISFLNRRVSNSTSYASRLIQTDAALNPGSSGGALVNMYGQVVGITSSKLLGTQYEGVSYAIPTTIVKFVVEELIEHGTVVSRVKLGVTYNEINEVIAAMNGTNLTGLLISEVSEESPLYGKITKGDIITEINGKKITKGDTVLDIVEACRPGDSVELTVYITKSGSSKTFNVNLIPAESSSSYKTELTSSTPSNDGVFDFPYGY